jgi:hypothetical protein
VDEGFKDAGVERHPLIYPSKMEEPFDYWCKETGQFFRSKSEATFVRWCVANGIDWKYEPYTLQFHDRQSYTPDFWLPEYSHFIEVKGLWGGSAKKKLRKMKELGFPIALVSDHLIHKLTRVRRSK